MTKKTIVINLFGASGIGKTTTSSAIFTELKRQGVRTELVREFVKEWVAAGIIPNGYDQAHIFGQQARLESVHYGKMDVLVTDSPLLISGFYENWHLGREIVTPGIRNFIKYAEENGVIFINFWLENYIVFDPRDRYEDEASSRAVHTAMKPWLLSQGLELIDVSVPDRQREFFILDIVNKVKASE